jgi:hypothetical protein
LPHNLTLLHFRFKLSFSSPSTFFFSGLFTFPLQQDLAITHTTPHKVASPRLATYLFMQIFSLEMNQQRYTVIQQQWAGKGHTFLP